MMGLVFNEDNHTYELDGRPLPSVTEILSILNDFSDVSPYVLAQAARRGTLVHEYCEMIDYGVDPNDLDIESDLVGYVQAYVNFLRDWNPTWSLIEQPVWTDAYAGTLDRYGKIDGHLALVDIKTSSSAGRRQKIVWACQLSAYDEAMQMRLESGGCIAHTQWDVQLKKDGTYTIHDRWESEDKYTFSADRVFPWCLNIYYILHGRKS